MCCFVVISNIFWMFSNNYTTDWCCMVPPLRYALCLVFNTISLHYKCDLYAYTYYRVNLNYLIKIQQLHLQSSVLKATVNKAMYVQYVHFHCIKIFRILAMCQPLWNSYIQVFWYCFIHDFVFICLLHSYLILRSHLPSDTMF